MSPKPSVKEERTQEIIEAALAVFSEQGFHRATMDEIANEAGVSKGTLYLYFNSKEKLISTLMEWFFKSEYSKFDQLVEVKKSAREILEESAQMIVEDLIEIQPFMPVLFEFISMSGRNKGVGDVVRENMYGFMSRIEPIFDIGIENGEFKPIDPSDLILAYGAIIEGTILVWNYDMDNIDIAKTMRNSIKIFLDGILRK